MSDAENDEQQQQQEEPASNEADGEQKVKVDGKVRRTRPTVHSCTSCNRTFSSRRDVVTHQYMHRENPTAFCSVCNKSFASEAAYRRHMASHSRSAASAAARRAGRKTCSQCNQQFDSMRQLSAHHAAKHVDQKRFVCAICGSQFAWPENLRAHQRTHEVDPHECDLCGRRFVDATSLRVHTRNAHGPSSEMPPPRKQHCCKLCGRMFQFDFSLRAHMKGHAQSPAAASLRRCKQQRQVSDTTPTETKYVRVDSKGVIDLGVDMTPVTGDNSTREIVVEVCANYDPLPTPTASNSQQTLDFSDVLDQSQLTEPRQDDDDKLASKLIWYVKPDEQSVQAVGPDEVTQTDNTQQSMAADSELSTSAPERTDDVHPSSSSTTADTAAAAADDVDDDDANAAVASVGECADGGEVSVQHSVTDESATLQPQPAVAAVDNSEPSAAQTDDDGDEAEDDEDDIDWILSEPPRKRAAPSFIYRAATAARQRHVTRPREPFLFNCVMTDEKPFHCGTCGQSFRWEISLNIHMRLHVDGTFPNKSRRSRGAIPCRRSAKPARATPKRSSPAAKSVGRSRIVQHRHSSSEEDDDEFTFHVHADGPAEVSAARSCRRRSSSRARGRGRGRAASRGTIAGGTVIDRRTVKIQSSPRCNGRVRSRTERRRAVSARATADQLSSRCDVVKQRRMMTLRAGLVCRHCAVIVTSHSALASHRRRSHQHTQPRCQSCLVGFKSQLDLRRHCMLVHSGTAGAVRCGRCNRVLSGVARLRQHYKLHRAAVKPRARLSSTASC